MTFRRPASFLVFGALLIAFPLLSARAEAAEAPGVFTADQIEFFEKNVRPVLANNCFDCHGDHRHENGLRLDTYAGILRGSDYSVVAIPGNPAESKLLKAIKHLDGAQAMPKKGAKLSDAEIGNIEKWIVMGMPWPAEKEPAGNSEKPSWESHWSFQKIENPKTPAIPDGGTSLDAFVAAKQAGAGLTFAPAADRATLGRRLYLTLTGLQPSYAALRKFIDDPSPEAPARLVDELLSSPQYGVRWARHWLDIARYADTEGYRAGGVDIRYPHAYTYRDWVINALNADLPYDQFIIQQLAADHLVEAGKSDPSLAALGFLTVNDSFQGDTTLQTDDRIDVVTRGVLGLTVSCARCHDHKYDPIPTKDYYALFSIFSSSEIPVELPIIGYPDDKAAVEAYNASVAEVEKEKLQMHEQVYGELRNADRLHDYLAFVRKAATLADEQFRGAAGKAELRDRIAQSFLELFKVHTAGDAPHPVLLAWKKFAELPEDQFAAKAASLSAELAKADSPVNPVIRNELAKRPAPKSFDDVARLYSDIFVTCMSGSEPDNADWQAIRALLMDSKSPMSVNVGDIHRFFTQKDRLEMVKLDNKINKLDLESPGAPRRAMAMKDREKPRDERIMVRGNVGRRGDPAPRGYLTMFGGQKFTQGSGRLELARAMTSRDNPLTARVIVNRVWAQHFGKPLVGQTSDFGVETSEPVQHALLDHLAATFMDEGWSLKKLHRHILNSRTWQQSSVSTPDKDLKDPENTLLTRQNRRRLDYESMRDTMLQTSESLVPASMGGRPTPFTDKAVDTRRSVYLFVDRFQQESVPAVFDFANPDTHSPVRSDTTVPQQALFLMNSPFARDQADRIARKVPVKEGKIDSGSISDIYERVLLRDPSEKEIGIASRFLNEAAGLQTGTPYTWQYGFADVTPATPEAPMKVGDFTHFKHFHHSKEKGTRWSVSETYPDKERGYPTFQRVSDDQKLAGHTGRGNTANVLRWIAPIDATIRIVAPFLHATKGGDGIQTWVISSRTGLLQEKHFKPGQGHEFRFENLTVKAGDILTFAAGRGGNEDSDSYHWTPRIEIQDSPGAPYALWTDSARDFLSTDKWPINVPRPQSPLSQLAQVLIISNEFQFVD
jgi:mono/diheme cytochrome c family protein